MFSNKPKMAKKWAKHTKDIKSLPEKEVVESLSVKDFFIFENTIPSPQKWPQADAFSYPIGFAQYDCIVIGDQ